MTSPDTIPKTPELVHANLTDIFLYANGDGLANSTTELRGPVTAITLGGGVEARDMTHSFHNDFFTPEIDEAFAGASMWIPTIGRMSANGYEDRRQRQLYFLQANQAFFEITVNGQSKRHTLYLGKPKLHGEDSLSTKFGKESYIQESENVRLTPHTQKARKKLEKAAVFIEQLARHQ
ncbi:MAG: hypothetical protein AAB436_04320 [Patescibacteria group bacterium]